MQINMTYRQWMLALAACGALVLLSKCAYADGLTEKGLDDPEVTPPAQMWSGPYVGLAYSRVTSSEESVQCFKLGQPKACDDPIFVYYPQFKEEVRTTTETSDDRAGFLLGYRWDMGKLVPGVEMAIYDSEVLPGAQLGLDLGRVLPYAYVDKDGAALGIEAKFGEHLAAGVRAGQDAAMFTLSWGF